MPNNNMKRRGEKEGKIKKGDEGEDMRGGGKGSLKKLGS